MKRAMLYSDGNKSDKKIEKKKEKVKKKIAKAVKKSGDDGSVSRKKMGLERTQLKLKDGSKIKEW